MDLGTLNLFQGLTPVAKTFYNSQEGARYAWQQVVNALGGNADSNYGRWLQSQFQTYWANYQNEVFQNTKEGATAPDPTVPTGTPGGTGGKPGGYGGGTGSGVIPATPAAPFTGGGTGGRTDPGTGGGGTGGAPPSTPRAPGTPGGTGGQTGTPAVTPPPDFTDWLNGHGGALSDQWQMLTANQRGANPNKFLGLGGRQLW